jgi:hypothetical protein
MGQRLDQRERLVYFIANYNLRKYPLYGLNLPAIKITMGN